MNRLFSIISVLLIAATTVMAQEGAKRYGVKSATVKMETEMIGQKIVTTSWFENYGNLEASVTDMGMMKVTTILKDGKTWVVNEAARQVQEMPDFLFLLCRRKLALHICESVFACPTENLDNSI